MTAHPPGIERIGDSHIVFQNRFITVRTDEVRLADGTFGEYSYVDDVEAAVTAVPFDVHSGRRSVLLVRQERYPTQSEGWEVPAGKVEPGETSLAAAQRELEEEAGISASLWHQLPTQFEYPGRSNARSDIFIAGGVSNPEQVAARDATEVIGDCRWFPVTDIEAMMLDGRINVGHTMASIAVANAFLKHNPDHPIAKLTRGVA